MLTREEGGLFIVSLATKDKKLLIHDGCAPVTADKRVENGEVACDSDGNGDVDGDGASAALVFFWLRQAQVIRG